MNVEMITGLIVNKSSNYYAIMKETAEIQKNYSINFIKEFERLSNCSLKLLEDEKCVYSRVYEFMNTDLFLNMLGNNRYRNKISDILKRDDLFLGNCKIKLINLENTLDFLCSSYKDEFREFVENSKKQIEAEIKQCDTHTKNEIREIFNKKICSMDFYNYISNENLV